MNFDLTSLIGAAIGIITILLGMASNALKAKAAAQTAQTNAQTALLKVGVLATTLAGRAWDKLGPEIQKVLADGKVTAEERAELEAVVKALVADFTSEDDLKALADALGLPLPGLIAKLATMLLDIFVRAHTPTDPSVSAKAFPVAEAPTANVPAEAYGQGG